MAKVTFHHRNGRIEKMQSRYANALEKMGRGYITRMMEAVHVVDSRSYDIDPVEPDIQDETSKNNYDDSAQFIDYAVKEPKKRTRKKKIDDDID